MSSLIATLINLNLPEGKTPVDPDEINPMVTAPRRRTMPSFSLEGARDRFELPTVVWEPGSIKVVDASQCEHDPSG